MRKTERRPARAAIVGRNVGRWSGLPSVIRIGVCSPSPLYWVFLGGAATAVLCLSFGGVLAVASPLYRAVSRACLSLTAVTCQGCDDHGGGSCVPTSRHAFPFLMLLDRMCPVVARACLFRKQGRNVMVQNAVVRAVDVGFGNVKYVTGHEHGHAVECHLFPSLAPQAGANQEIGAGVLQNRNTVIVEVDGVRYEVGPDAALALDATHGRVLDQSFPETDTYKALLRGALAYMDVPEIDLLVLGLPVNNFPNYRDHVEKVMSGRHRVPDIKLHQAGSLAAERDVTVKSVWVLPQPLGGFFDHALRNKLFGSMKSQHNLIIDIGFYTVDWLMTVGVKPVGNRSSAVNGGMSAILTLVAERVAAQHKTQTPLLKSVEEAVRSGSPVRVFGKECDISEHIAAGKAKAREAVAQLVNKVGDGADIDNIILSGGGASFFEDVIQEKYPHHKLVIAGDPVFANVRGFQVAGEEQLVIRQTNRSRAGVHAS